MKLGQKCMYCGNTSGKLDDKGGCISCGAFLPLVPEEEEVVAPPSGTVSQSFIWTGITGSVSDMKWGKMNSDLVRRIVGLDENA